jgi:hypothetical protein
VTIARTSCVAAAFIAAVTEASDHLPSLRPSRLTAASLAEELTLERVEGVDVVTGPRLGGGAVGGEVGVGSGDEGERASRAAVQLAGRERQ